eukprot:4458863-Alexandrium_andersonii.AAC.1
MHKHGNALMLAAKGLSLEVGTHARFGRQTHALFRRDTRPDTLQEGHRVLNGDGVFQGVLLK